MAWDRYAYVMNNPVKYTDPSGNRPIIGDDKFGNPITYNPYLKFNYENLIIPSPISEWEEIRDNPLELMARAILSEEGVKLNTYGEIDAFGVAWAIINRYHDWYTNEEHIRGRYGSDYDISTAWQLAATSDVQGMDSRLAHDPMNNWKKYFTSEEELLKAYNRALEIAEYVFESDRSEDITNSAIRWSDAKCSGGKCEYDEDGYLTNGIPYIHTHFSDDIDTYKPNWCVTVIPENLCK